MDIWGQSFISGRKEEKETFIALKCTVVDNRSFLLPVYKFAIAEEEKLIFLVSFILGS